MYLGRIVQKRIVFKNKEKYRAYRMQNVLYGNLFVTKQSLQVLLFSYSFSELLGLSLKSQLALDLLVVQADGCSKKLLCTRGFSVSQMIVMFRQRIVIIKYDFEFLWKYLF